MQTNNLTMFFIMYIGELNTETRMRDDKERYYVIWMEVTMASQLRSFSVSNTLTESVVIGMCMYCMPFKLALCIYV